VQLLPSAGRDATALDINDQGLIVGYAKAGDRLHAAVWTSLTRFVDLGFEGETMAVNSRGFAVGASERDARHAFRWSEPIGTEVLADPEGLASCGAYGLNDSNAIVGSCMVPGPEPASRAVKWVSGQAIDLNTMLVDAPAGFVFESARGINHDGRIVGSGTIAGKRCGVLLVPVPA
jgi:uncharacterized membrane protein